ncbi:RNA-directed DNA polymerase from mobile element jockey [Araneus ventricosus]|uniref:RNA-directed DNA polymerase from mobile element jockey n=1 Tax=Araneus ventricosus TaxID=182803 RepID=A0A4Y2UNN9_ARAVE|nr:RNA-directed DNA polymerase from mobile element jockey [Araneus ventricosus]
MTNSPHNFNQILNSTDLENEISNFTDNINCAFNANSKAIDPTTQYINNKIKEIHHDRNVARRKWQTTRNPAFKTLWNKLHRQAVKIEEKIRQDDWNDKLIALQPNDNTLWNTAKQMRKQHTKISALKGHTSIALSNTEKAETLADSLENQFKINNMSDPNTETLVNNTSLNFLNSPTNSDITPPTFLELLYHTNKLNIRKAPGIDGITNKIIRNVPLITMLRFHHLVTHIFKLKHFPTSWKTAVVIPILKQGKDSTIPSNYRPISLLPNFSKITEHFILQRINEHFNSNNILIPFQFGFKPKLSTTHQLLRATEIISAGFENEEHTGAVFLDVQKAFDRVWLNGLTYKLITHNTPPPLIKLITSFLLNRKFSVRVNATLSKLRHIQAGVRQGAKLSPALYSIFINDIPQKHNTTLCIYADDTAILAKNKNTRYLTSALKKHIQELECWFHKWKIAINTSKTEAVLFTKKRKIPNSNIKILNTIIPWSQEAKYLVVILDKQLTWKSHINFIKQKFRDNSRKLYPLILQ